MVDQIVITEKSSQAKDVRTAVGSRFGQILPAESANGPWRKQEYILETEGQYPKKICFMVWSDKIDEFAIKEGENLVVSIDLESREYDGRWHTDVKAWKVTRAGAETDNIPFSALRKTISRSLKVHLH
jgi:hypothetical protein